MMNGYTIEKMVMAATAGLIQLNSTETIGYWGDERLFDLPVKKQVGDLDYTLIRTPNTEITTQEMKYCENDCLVIYYYIQRELETYERVDKIPLTSTGHVRRELKERISEDWNYKNKVKKNK